MSKAGIGYLIFFSLILGGILTWNFTVRRPQIKAVKNFLEALKERDADLLKNTVLPSEYSVYAELYLKNGYNKHLLNYSRIDEKDANNHFFPTKSRFSVRVEEDDVFFGKRTQDYLVSLNKEKDTWQVIQFVTMGDYSDLAALKEFKPKATVH